MKSRTGRSKNNNPTLCFLFREGEA